MRRERQAAMPSLGGNGFGPAERWGDTDAWSWSRCLPGARNEQRAPVSQEVADVIHCQLVNQPRTS